MSEKNNDGITQISELKNFGIFKDFTWEEQKDFGKNNLIYGWNYSGKTTISKIFQMIEFEQNEYDKSDIGFREGHFKLKCNKSGNSWEYFTEESISDFPFLVKVFNANYINRIFSWNNPDSGIDAISFYLGDEAREIKNELEQVEKNNKDLEELKATSEEQMKPFEEYAKSGGKFTNLAKKMKTEYLKGIYREDNFDKRGVGKIVKEIERDLEGNRLHEDELNSQKKEAIAKVDGFTSEKIETDCVQKFNELKEEVKDILNCSPESADLENLRDNSKLSQWVQEGLEHHTVPDSTCQFCLNELSKDRFNELNAFYSEALTILQSRIENANEEIVKEINKFKSLFPDRMLITEPYREEYNNKLSEYDNTFREYEEQLKVLENDLKRKKENPFNELEASKVKEIPLKENILSIESIIEKNNEYIRNAENKKTDAIKKLEKHYVADELIRDNYLKKKEIYNQEKNKKGELIENIRTNTKKICELDENLRDIGKGEMELNKRIQSLLNTNIIKIEIKDGEFYLKRGDKYADNLSEGEKTVIAFSYFMTTLEASKSRNNLSNTIVYIDDPISSLDSGNIDGVVAFIKSFFEDIDAFQLFISTHNFDFLMGLIDTNLFGRIRSSGETPTKNRNTYLIKRKRENDAIIENMPSEYLVSRIQYIIRIDYLKKYIDSLDSNPNNELHDVTSLLLPNVLRTVIEEYALMMRPSAESLEKKLKEIFEDECNKNVGKDVKDLRRIINFLNSYSHPNLLKSSMHFDEQLPNIEFAIKYFFDYLEEFHSVHWNGIERSIKSIDEAKKKSGKG